MEGRDADPEKENKMTFWEFMGVALSSAGLFAAILGAFLTYASRKNGQATRELIGSLEERMASLLERMDTRADERHREVIHAIGALRGM
jgi:hypothetical protein